MSDLFETKEQCYFIKRDSTGKIRGIETHFEKIDKDLYKISRCSFQYQGKEEIFFI